MAALRGDTTLVAQSEQFDVHVKLIVQRQQQGVENLAAAFDLEPDVRR